MPEHSHDFYQEEYDEYMKATPLEARFDPTTIQMLVVEAIPKHAAYEMMFDEYLKQRSRFSEYDDSAKKRLSIYLPLFPAMRSQDFAYECKVSLHKFLVTILELGLITVLYDFHEDCSEAKMSKDLLSKSIRDSRSKLRYLQIDKQKVGLSSGAGMRVGGSRHFTPHVQEWMYNAVNDTAAYLNMTASDLAYLCWCVGVQKTLPLGMVDVMLDKDIDIIVDTFRYELLMYVKRINGLVSEIHVSD